jgi:hypothetical protein
MHSASPYGLRAGLPSPSLPRRELDRIGQWCLFEGDILKLADLYTSSMAWSDAWPTGLVAA